MARGKVRYVGEAIAAVAAEDPLTAKRAAAAINVDYEPLPAVFDPDVAMRPGAPVSRLRARQRDQAHSDPRRRVEAAFATCDLVVEETYETQPIEHAYLEPEAGLAYVDHDGVVTLVSPTRTSRITGICWRDHRQADPRCASS